MSDSERAEVRGWMDQATGAFLAAVDRLDDAAFAQPSTLPGWTNAELVAHVHFNAEALRRLASWARTGLEARMYASREERNAEIAKGRSLRPSQLRSMVHASAQALADDLDALDEQMWSHTVVTAMGRSVPAEEILWMRTREVAVHAVDLGADVTFADLPDALLHRLIAEIVAKRLTSGQAPTLAAWLTGRAAGAELGPWL